MSCHIPVLSRLIQMMTTLPKLRLPRETAVTSSLPCVPHPAPSAPRRSKTVIGMKTTSYSLDCNSKSSIVFPWLHANMGGPGVQPMPKGEFPKPTREKTFTLVTTDASFEREMRQLQKKRDQYHQFYRKWKRPFYGTVVEQEEYRKEIRGVLKDQMSTKLRERDQYMKDKVQESMQACNYDRECIDKDRTARQEKAVFLRKFRDDNKKAIEERERIKRETRIISAEEEQKLLRQNPVNWSQSLK